MPARREILISKSLSTVCFSPASPPAYWPAAAGPASKTPACMQLSITRPSIHLNDTHRHVQSQFACISGPVKLTALLGLGRSWCHATQRRWRLSWRRCGLHAWLPCLLGAHTLCGCWMMGMMQTRRPGSTACRTLECAMSPSAGVKEVNAAVHVHPTSAGMIALGRVHLHAACLDVRGEAFCAGPGRMLSPCA